MIPTISGSKLLGDFFIIGGQTLYWYPDMELTTFLRSYLNYTYPLDVKFNLPHLLSTFFCYIHCQTFLLSVGACQLNELS